MKKFMSVLFSAVILMTVSMPLFNVFAAQTLSFLKGDADADGILTAADSRLVLRCSVNLEKLSDIRICDMDNDEKITSSDARKILRLSVGLSEEEPSDITKNEFMNQFSDTVSSDDLSYRMKWLVNDIGPRSWWDYSQNNAGDLIYSVLSSYGYSGNNLIKQDFIKNGITGRNIIALIPTEKEDPDIILVSAHYDTARGTGAAVDNSSGTAALMQLAKIFFNKETDYGAEIRFLFTAGEEQGYFGAYAYVKSLTETERSRHAMVFNIDMAGKPADSYSPGIKYYISVCTETVSTDGYQAPEAEHNKGSDAVDEAYKLLGGAGDDGYYSPVRAGAHDILPFRKMDMPALTVSWRRINASHSMGSDYNLASPSLIHTKQDNINNFDMNSLYLTTKLIASSVAGFIYPYCCH